jgi:hypothetical protein
VFTYAETLCISIYTQVCVQANQTGVLREANLTAALPSAYYMSNTSLRRTLSDMHGRGGHLRISSWFSISNIFASFGLIYLALSFRVRSGLFHIAQSGIFLNLTNLHHMWVNLCVYL